MVNSYLIVLSDLRYFDSQNYYHFVFFVKQAINMRNQLLHSPDHKLPQNKFDEHMNTIKDVLEIPALSCYPEISTCKKELREVGNIE